MSRFFGLILMVATGAVSAPLVAFAFNNEGLALGVLAVLMAGLGLLFGFLATARHWFWAIAASVAITGSLAYSWPAQTNQPVRSGVPPPSAGFHTGMLVIPTAALLLFSTLGARVLHQRVREATTPADE